MAAFRDDGSARYFLKARCQRRMVPVGMGHENMADRTSGNGLDQRVELRVVVRARVYDRQRVPTNHIAVRAVEGERPGIVHSQAQNIFRDRNCLAIGWSERRIECERHRSDLCG